MGMHLVNDVIREFTVLFSGKSGMLRAALRLQSGPWILANFKANFAIRPASYACGRARLRRLPSASTDPPPPRLKLTSGRVTTPIRLGKLSVAWEMPLPFTNCI
jgi:hypothetical protein